MRLAEELSRDELLEVVHAVQAQLYLDEDGSRNLIWNPDKEWSGPDVLQNIAQTLDQCGLIPEEIAEAR